MTHKGRNEGNVLGIQLLQDGTFKLNAQIVRTPGVLEKDKPLRLSLQCDVASSATSNEP